MSDDPIPDLDAFERLMAQANGGEVVDFARLSGLIEHGVTTHPERERVYSWLRQGATFHARHRDGEVEVRLAFTDEAEVVAAMRADVWGHEPEPVDPANVGQTLDVISAPVATLRTVNQG